VNDLFRELGLQARTIAICDFRADRELAPFSPSRVGARPPGHALGHAVKPRPDRGAVPNRAGVAHQYEKRGLKSVLGIVGISY
jgi:hypothetical protein